MMQNCLNNQNPLLKKQLTWININPNFQQKGKTFEIENYRKINKNNYLVKVEIKDYNVMSDGKNFFDWPVKNDMRVYHKVCKIATGWGGDCTTSCFLGYNCFNKFYKMIAIDLSNQRALDTDSKAIQQINVTGDLDWS